MMYKFRQTILDGHLCMTNFCNVSFKATNSPMEYLVMDQEIHEGVILTPNQLPP